MQGVEGSALCMSCRPSTTPTRTAHRVPSGGFNSNDSQGRPRAVRQLDAASRGFAGGPRNASLKKFAVQEAARRCALAGDGSSFEDWKKRISLSLSLSLSLRWTRLQDDARACSAEQWAVIKSHSLHCPARMRSSNSGFALWWSGGSVRPAQHAYLF